MPVMRYTPSAVIRGTVKWAKVPEGTDELEVIVAVDVDGLGTVMVGFHGNDDLKLARRAENLQPGTVAAFAVTKLPGRGLFGDGAYDGHGLTGTGFQDVVTHRRITVSGDKLVAAATAVLTASRSAARHARLDS